MRVCTCVLEQFNLSTEREKLIIRQPPIGEKDDYDSENSWISDGLPTAPPSTYSFPPLVSDCTRSSPHTNAHQHARLHTQHPHMYTHANTKHGDRLQSSVRVVPSECVQ